MTNTALFFKKNKKVKENVKYAATKTLCDEKGKPLEWELKPVSTKEYNTIQEQCTEKLPGKNGGHTFNSTKYMIKLVVASVVFPDLLNAELQDSYGVSTADDLVQEMIDDGGEWSALTDFIVKYNNFTSVKEDIAEAKN